MKYQVYHPEGWDHNLSPRTFATKQEAKKARREWNKEMPGHVVKKVREVGK